MLYELKPKGFRKARVWLGEIPEALETLAPEHPETLERTLAPGPHRIEERRQVALEVFIPLGGMIGGILLGAEFSPGTGPLELRVRHGEEEGPWLDWTYQRMSVGIPSEFAAAVLEGAARACEALGMGSGVLRFHWGAVSPVGSSVRVSDRTAALVVELLLLYPSGPSASETLSEVLRRGPLL